MANLFSILLGIVALIMALVGIFPLLGWLNWFVLVVAGLGFLLGLVAEANAGRNFNMFVIALAGLRLIVGGGLI